MAPIQLLPFLRDAQVPYGFVERALRAGSSGGGTLSDGSLRVSWQESSGLLQQISAFLEDKGCAPQEPVALMCCNSVAGALTLLALLLSGRSFGLFPETDGRGGDTVVPRLFRYQLALLAKSSDGGNVSLARPESFLRVRQIDGHVPLPPESLLRRGRVLLRTSGSLGSPKLVVHTHEKLVANALNVVERLSLGSNDNVSIPVPLAHMYGLGAAFLPSFSVGASIDLIERANLIRYLERERSFRPSIAFLTPNLCSMLRRPRSSPCAYRQAVVAGDRLSAEGFVQAESIFRRVTALYGSTELGAISAADANEDPRDRLRSAGRALPGVQLRVDPNATEAAKEDELGELLCAHPYGFDGYVDADGDPVLEAAPSPDGWYRTRDLVRLHPEGLVEVLGRLDHAVKRDGRLVMLAEVERALGQIDCVSGAAAIVGDETPRGRMIVAFYTTRNGMAPDSTALWRACRAVLPSYAVPDALYRLDALPLLPNGKLDRRSLQQVDTHSLHL